MAEHPIQGLMSTAMDNIKQMVDVNTIIGDPVETPDGTVIIPISKVGFGFAAGGSEFDMQGEKAPYGTQGQDKNNAGHPFGGGAGGGVSITPMGFLVVGHGNIKLLSSEGTTQIYDRLVDLVPTVIDRVQAMAKSPNSSDRPNPEQENADNRMADQQQGKQSQQHMQSKVPMQ
ncbi:GerW family sporulation protein [Fodinisporobacter ferrooxydans]|uniref:GerW family sporulation protein n=1 Tax=Fodinisporobacter ferrooxydans TaxID=2901836 RepID=A0ABY4CH83_9BACL|nr:GerW family sporulation protein [Alicyclobacillaceae bacterium MYW30-H2]